MEIDRPIYVVGTGRSGTTLAFELLSAHPDLAWFSQYVNRFPGFPAVAVLSRLVDVSGIFRKSIERSDQRRSWLERLRIGPVEAYGLYERCCGKKFRYDFLLDVEATEEERQRLRAAVFGCLRYQGKPRFAAKITGPGRIHYLDSVFDDAIFVNVIRDGRAVVQSFLHVDFWKHDGRRSEPNWQHGLGEAELACWERYERDPMALAAIQWRACVERTREEASRLPRGRYAEVRYEDLVAHPAAVLDEILAFCHLPPAHAVHDFLSQRFELRNMNDRWGERFSRKEIAMLEDLMGPCLDRLGYRERERESKPPYLRAIADSYEAPRTCT